MAPSQFVFMPMQTGITHAGAHHPSDRRTGRVLWLLAGITVLSLADLLLTLTYMMSVGMNEGNPIAAWIVTATQSPWALAMYKLVTVTICVGLLYRVRHQRVGELAAWCSLLILVALSVWWNQYARYQPLLPRGEVLVMAGPDLNHTSSLQ